MSEKPNNARRTGPALEKAYQFVLWLIPTVEKFPRGQRFLLGDHIQTTVLEVTEGIVEATYSAQTEPILRRVNLALEKLRLLFRLAKDLRRYEFAARSIDEIGRLIGGWIKAGRAAPSH